MTQEAFKEWWYSEGSQASYTHHDCEEHTMRMYEIAWANGAYKEREEANARAQPEQEPMTLQQKAKYKSVSAVCAKKKKTPTVKKLCNEWEQHNEQKRI